MAEQATVLSWLLEDDPPSVRVRALTGLCGYPPDHAEVLAARQRAMEALPAARDLSWMEMQGQILTYNLTALAESGLTCTDVPVEKAVDKLLAEPFDANCGQLMALRALVMLGYGHDPRIGERLAELQEAQLPDGAWLCLHRVHKMRVMPKSCIRAAMHGLLFFAELRRQGLQAGGAEPLIDYFVRRRVFYRTDDPAQLVLNDHPGRRMTDAFFPIEYFRVGLPVLLEAFAALGVGGAPELREAWRLLEGKVDARGSVRLEGTLPSKSCYLPRERVGKPSKWATLYTCLAREHKDRGSAR